MTDAENPTWRDVAAQLDSTARYGLAFSGGCDSAFLLAALMRAGIDVKAYMVLTAFQADFELDDARRVVEEAGAAFELIRADVLANDAIRANPWNRCYHCKRFIFGEIMAAMERDGRAVLLDGTNATDDPVRRPGFRALEEWGVVSPLRLAGFTKEQVRSASRAIGLSTADKPSFSCFATKVPEGAPITQEALAEAALSPECREAARWAWMRG
ncbi:MAG: asparagine synthase-related protein [Slackia sp.]|nr:asparagine synthase-related protein [Slackia sp.]